MKKTILLASLWLAAFCAHGQDFAYKIRAEVQTAGPESLDDLTWQQGTTPLLRIEPVRDGKPIAADSGTIVSMVIGPTATGAYFASATNYAAVSNFYLVQWPTIGTNSHGTNATAQAWWFTVYFENAGRRYWTGNGRLYIEATTSTATNGLVWQQYTVGSVAWNNVVGDPAASTSLTAFIAGQVGTSTNSDALHGNTNTPLYSLGAFSNVVWVSLDAPTNAMLQSGWTNSIQAGINICPPGGIVAIAPGTYTLTAGLTVTNAITIAGSGRSATFINGGGAGTDFRGFTFTNGGYNAVVEDLTVQNFRAVKGGAGAWYGTFNRCNFLNNSSVWSLVVADSGQGGAAMYSTLNNCLVERNYAEKGGGGLRSCEANYSTISNNWTASTGGGMYGGYANFCTIVTNTGVTGAGGGDRVELYNCTILNNQHTGGSNNGTNLWDCWIDECRIMQPKASLNTVRIKNSVIDGVLWFDGTNNVQAMVDTQAVERAERIAADTNKVNLTDYNAAGSTTNYMSRTAPIAFGNLDMNDNAITTVLSLSYGESYIGMDDRTFTAPASPSSPWTFDRLAVSGDLDVGPSSLWIQDESISTNKVTFYYGDETFQILDHQLKSVPWIDISGSKIFQSLRIQNPSGQTGDYCLVTSTNITYYTQSGTPAMRFNANTAAISVTGSVTAASIVFSDGTTQYTASASSSGSTTNFVVGGPTALQQDAGRTCWIVRASANAYKMTLTNSPSWLALGPGMVGTDGVGGPLYVEIIAGTNTLSFGAGIQPTGIGAYTAYVGRTSTSIILSKPSFTNLYELYQLR